MTSSLDPDPSDPAPFVMREPSDLLAAAPVLLGFVPTESLVLLTFGGARAFHARVDLPRSEEDDATVLDLLLEPALLHGIPRVVLIGYGADQRQVERVVAAGRRRFDRAGMEVLEALRADGRRWWLVPDRPGLPEAGVPYQLDEHRITAEAVLAGHVVHGTREDLRASLAPDPDRAAGVVAALADLTTGPPPVLAEGRWVQTVVARHIDRGTTPDDAEVARLLRGMLVLRVRDAAWSVLREARARQHVDLWRDVLRRSPDRLAAAPAALLALAAWQAGDGALAWCALDRCTEVDPDYSLAEIVGHLLQSAVPPGSWPDDWEGGPDWSVGLVS